MRHITPFNRNYIGNIDGLFDQFLAPTSYESMDFNPKLDVKEFDDH